MTAGKIAKEVYFIKSCCIRLFYEKDGEDISAYFFTEKMFAGAYDSFISRKPSRQNHEGYIKVLEFKSRGQKSRNLGQAR